MKKNSKMFLLIFIIIVTLTACGKQKTDTSAEVSSETMVLEDVAVSEETQGEEAEETQGEVLEETQEETVAESQEEIVEDGFSFAEFKNLEFYFASGAGGWRTIMTISEDGTFQGVYNDSDMGSYTETYPRGTQYYCSFHGKFTKPVQKEEYIYTTTIENISYEHPIDTEEIKDGIRYIYTDAYGLDDPKEILIYLPGMPIEKLPEGYLSWVRGNWIMDFDFMETEEVLPFYGLYNVNAEQGFSSYNIIDELKDSLTFKEEMASSLENSIKNDILSQGELNEKSQQMYEIWDVALNEIWEVLKVNLDANTMETLTEEQLEWIAWKEQDMKEAGAEVEGGSMVDMVIYQRGARLTKDRVYELMEVVNEVADIETEEWNEQEIISLFNSKAEEDWTVIDCAAVTDFAYERIGVVLYKDSTSEYTHVAFLDADGNMQSCGVEAEYCEEFGLEYSGDGEVSFGAQTKDGITYLQKITISIEGSEVNFISESVADDEE